MMHIKEGDDLITKECVEGEILIYGYLNNDHSHNDTTFRKY